MNGAKGNPQTLSCLLKHPREENQEHDGAKILHNKGKSKYCSKDSEEEHASEMNLLLEGKQVWNTGIPFRYMKI